LLFEVVFNVILDGNQTEIGKNKQKKPAFQQDLNSNPDSYTPIKKGASCAGMTILYSNGS